MKTVFNLYTQTRLLGQKVTLRGQSNGLFVIYAACSNREGKARISGNVARVSICVLFSVVDRNGQATSEYNRGTIWQVCKPADADKGWIQIMKSVLGVLLIRILETASGWSVLVPSIEPGTPLIFPYLCPRQETVPMHRDLVMRDEMGLRSEHFPATTEPARVVPDATLVHGAGRHADAHGNAAPEPATQNVGLPSRWPPGVLRGAVLVIVWVVAVIQPFPNVPQHIVQTESVGSLLAHFVHCDPVFVQTLLIINWLPQNLGAVQALAPTVIRDQAISSRYPYRAAVLPARVAYSHSASVGSLPPAQPQ
jgi:hypothetical protein